MKKISYILFGLLTLMVMVLLAKGPPKHKKKKKGFFNFHIEENKDKVLLKNSEDNQN